MDFERLKEHRNHLNAFANYIGLHITQLGEGSARAEMPVTKDHLNPIGSVHGGCLATMADVVGGAAASSYGCLLYTSPVPCSGPSYAFPKFFS